MEQLADTDDESESRDHRIVARWINHFLEFIPSEVESAFSAIKAEAEGKVERIEPGSGGSAFMESDGTEPSINDAA